MFAGYITYTWGKAGGQGLTPEIPCKTKIQEDLQSPLATLKGPSLLYEYSQSITVPYMLNKNCMVYCVRQQLDLEGSQR